MKFTLWLGGFLLLSGLGGCGGGGGEAVLIPLQNPVNPSGTTNAAGTNTPGTPASTTGSGAPGTTTNTAGTPATESGGGTSTPANTGSATPGASSGAGGGAASASSPSTPVYGTVVVTAVSAPADGTALSGSILLKVEGTNIQNAELLPASGYTPRLGVFVVAPDLKSASLVLNTNTIPNGTLSVRISAYNTPPGTPGASEVIAMPARTWRFANQPPPFGTQEGRAARCQMMGVPYTDTGMDLPVVCITAAPTSTPPAQCSNLGTGYGDPTDLLPVLRNGTPVAKLYCEPGANGGVVNTGCVCLS